MRFPVSVPSNIVVGILIFFGLLLGGYFVGSTHAVSTTPYYLTDSSGSNAASVSSKGHVSVHIADPNLPESSGPLDATRTTFAPQSLTTGECYEAYFSGAGSFISASVAIKPGSGSGRPGVLVRVDRAVVWVESRSADRTPLAPASGAVISGSDYVFGFGYTLQFKAFVGVDLCWRGPGTSDSFAITMTVAGLAGQILHPEAMTFTPTSAGSGRTFQWSPVEGPAPVGYRLYGSNNPAVAYYHPLANEIRYSTGTRTYTSGATGSVPLHLYVFELPPAGNPTRVGPFGSWKGL